MVPAVGLPRAKGGERLPGPVACKASCAWGSWTSSLRPEGLGAQGGEQIGEEEPAQDEPETSPAPLQTLTHVPGQRDEGQLL